MSPEDQLMFREYFDMFNTPGWARLIADLEDNRVLVNTVRNVPDAAMLHKLQGKLEVLDNMISLRLYMENLYDDMTREDKL